MTSETPRDRCPSCGAAVRADAAWCGQCYANLRPEPTPPPPAPPAPPAPLADVAPPVGIVSNAAATMLAEPPLPGVVRPDPLLDVAPPLVPVAPPVDVPTTWPCGRCKTPVPFEDDTCPHCNARFLDPQLPGVEKTLVDKLPRGPRKTTNAFLIMVIGGLTLMGVFIGLLALLGTIF